FAVPIPDQHARNRRALAFYPLIEAELLEDAEPIGCQIQETPSIIGRCGSGLINFHLNTCLLQEQGDDRSSDPAANNQRFSGGSDHSMILSLQLVTLQGLPRS